ncbi:GRB2-related adapter protein 2b [Notolabrus celidotus]|uniref:GRB2-related adapter protein 2b n=1 Tax=Notolabrus celidotus TaxID=1203425 RepID=UPI00148F8E8D|nr:GRB2-related adapter protein 2b [Notolabrus celidotus]
MEAMAKYDYEATASDELGFAKGERLKVLKTSGNWFKAELDGTRGFVPKNFIDIHLPSWYQEDCSRSDAEDVLMSQPVGSFVIRGSQSSAMSDFSISVRHAADVQHFKVLGNSRGQYYLWSEKFPSINQLVEHYKHNSVSRQTQIFLQETQQQQKKEAVGDRPSVPAPPLPDRSSIPVTAPALREHIPSPTMQVRALYGFYAEEKDELDFDAGDVITVLDHSDYSWWRGELRGKTGLFPSNYTTSL